jgi:segregation and condensation protein B
MNNKGKDAENDIVESAELQDFEATNIYTEEESTEFLAESVEGTELDAFESASIEEVDFIEDERLESILESILFASDRPVSLAALKVIFKGTNIKTDRIRRALDQLAVELAGSRRGVTLEEVTGGYQLRTKIDNLEFMKRSLKARPFRLSGPALEVLAIAAYKQPLIKHEIDEIRGVESGHLLRALMEKNLITFEGKAEDKIGKPMQYGTTKKFLEIFGLRNLKELPTLSQIDELLPEGITEDEDRQKLQLSDLTEPLSQSIGASYSDGEDELMKVAHQLEQINTSSDFFEQEKKRQQEKRDMDRAQNIRDAIMVGEEVSKRDRQWLARYDEALMEGTSVTSPEAAENQPADIDA